MVECVDWRLIPIVIVAVAHITAHSAHTVKSEQWTHPERRSDFIHEAARKIYNLICNKWAPMRLLTNAPLPRMHGISHQYSIYMRRLWSHWWWLDSDNGTTQTTDGNYRNFNAITAYVRTLLYDRWMEIHDSTCFISTKNCHEYVTDNMYFFGSFLFVGRVLPDHVHWMAEPSSRDDDNLTF